MRETTRRGFLRSSAAVAALATGGASVPFQLLFLLLLGAMVVGSALTVASLVGHAAWSLTLGATFAVLTEAIGPAVDDEAASQASTDPQSQ